MTAENKSKALVLSGGGITGTAWELGVLRGLKEGGVDVLDFNLIVGTSAGSSVGAQLISGWGIEELYNLQMKPISETNESTVEFDGQKFREMMAAAIMSSPDSQTARKRIGEAALNTKTMSEEERLEIIASRLPNHQWNNKISLIINVVDAETGEWKIFDKDSDIPLLLAVTASSAIPGIYPPTTINGRRYIDGGMSSGTNADLAKDEDLVLILVSEPTMTAAAMGPTMHRITFEEELQVLKESGAEVMVITPDETSIKAKGINPLNPEKRRDAAQSGFKQGLLLADKVGKFLKAIN
ncbi:MAG: patatin-like phospholipase family protein [Methanobacterium sp.]|nr:patatin-like phospholipase family protein [Methanobacterium sp.]